MGRLFFQDSVLDMCSGPGGKSLAILQTLLPSRLMCVDYHPNRLQRVRLTVENYLRGVDEFKKRIEFQARNGNELPITHFNEFTKVKTCCKMS